MQPNDSSWQPDESIQPNGSPVSGQQISGVPGPSDSGPQFRQPDPQSIQIEHNAPAPFQSPVLDIPHDAPPPDPIPSPNSPSIPFASPNPPLPAQPAIPSNLTPLPLNQPVPLSPAGPIPQQPASLLQQTPRTPWHQRRPAFLRRSGGNPNFQQAQALPQQPYAAESVYAPQGYTDAGAPPAQPIPQSGDPRLTQTAQQVPSMPAFMRAGSQDVPQPTQLQTPSPQPLMTESMYAAGDYATYAAPPRRNKSLRILVVVILVALIGTGATFAYASLGKATPDKVFQAALNNSLATPQQKLTLQAQDVTATILYDLPNTNDPRISEDISIKLFGNLEANNYASKQDTYILFKHLGDSTSDKQFSSVLNKWVQLKKAGKTVSGADSLSADAVTIIADLPGSLAGTDWPLGNFSAKDRQNLTDFIISNQLYKYDAQKVTKSTLSGQQVYVYGVTLNKSKLTDLTKKELALWGFSSSDISDVVNEGAEDLSNVKLYIDISSKHILKLTGTADAGTETVTFDYAGIKFPSEPKSQLSVDQLSQTLDTVSSGLNGTADGTGDTSTGSLSDGSGSGASQPANSQDTEREADIDSLQANLEAYYSDNGNYPTFAEMNDANWLSTNLTYFDPETFKDPASSGTALAAQPTAHQYAYQVGTGDDLASCAGNQATCQYYVISAVLSNGTVYSKKTLE